MRRPLIDGLQPGEIGTRWQFECSYAREKTSRASRFRDCSRLVACFLSSTIFLLLFSISRIRHIFLQPRPHVSIVQAEGLLGWTRRQMSEAIENGDVELWRTPLGKWFPRAEMMAKALEIWPMHVIEEALGDDAEGILPQAIRSAGLRVRLPRHHIDMLHYRADQQETTVSGVLERELDGIASAHIEELSAALPGFAEAMAWPVG